MVCHAKVISYIVKDWFSINNLNTRYQYKISRRLLGLELLKHDMLLQMYLIRALCLSSMVLFSPIHCRCSYLTWYFCLLLSML